MKQGIGYRPWDDVHAPQRFHRVDPTARTVPLYIGEPDWRMNRSTALYLASFFMAVAILAIAIS